MRQGEAANLSGQFVPRVEQPTQRFNGQLARSNLHAYQLEILALERIVQDYRLFRLSCLSNFDDIDTRVNSDYTEEEALQRLHHHLFRLKELRGDLLQNLHEYRQEIEPSGLVERIHTLEADLGELKQYLDSNLTDINLMMVKVLKNLHSRSQSFTKQHERNTTLYSRLATVLDNMEAMRQQTRHMEEERAVMRSHFTNLASGSYDNAVKATSSYRGTLRERHHIYESNLKMLTRMTGETSIPDYHRLLQKYRAAFIQYGKHIEEFDGDVLKFERLLRQRQEAQNLGRVVVTHSRQEDIYALNKLYSALLAGDAPVELFPLREQLLQDIERDLKMVGVVLPDRDHHASRVELIRSRLKSYTEYFTKL